MRLFGRLVVAAVLGAGALVMGLDGSGGPGVASARAGHEDDDRYEVPDETWTWEDGDVLDDGTTRDGYYRPAARPGYAWVEGHYEGRVWVPGDYRPVAPGAGGMVWEPGFRGSDGYFVMGYWRPATRVGYVWIAGGPGRPGVWRVVDGRRDGVWEDGYWTPDGVWIDGTWRERGRVGFRWVPGEWRWGRFIPGHWEPTAQKRGHVWVAGYWGPRGWVDGYWRERARDGYYWRGGYWAPGGAWVAGEWVNGRRAVVVGSNRPRPVPVMLRERRAERHHWREGRREERRGHRMEERGERIEHRGERTGNERMEERGERMQEHGHQHVEHGQQMQGHGNGKPKPKPRPKPRPH